ncbi:hypothetical protein MVI01_63990 [Myxococcus virescens]|uniref:Ig-like domain-containing protein n=1 Tax=Myxococcus virescens TaxID=83456 RepID=A0A511HMM4_9BACT|nr:hypothetical protein MVI01_63990 [Myxococcus virescens]
MKRPVVLILSASAMLVAAGCGPDMPEEMGEGHVAQEQSVVPGCSTSVTPPYVISGPSGPISVGATATVVCDSVQPVINLQARLAFPAGPLWSSNGKTCYGVSSCTVEDRSGYIPGVWESRGTSPDGGDTLPISVSL